MTPRDGSIVIGGRPAALTAPPVAAVERAGRLAATSTPT